jgi:hypothetical protein
MGKTITSKTEEWLNGKIHVIVQKENKSTKDHMVYSNRQVKEGRKETSIYCETCHRKPSLHPGCVSKNATTV